MLYIDEYPIKATYFPDNTPQVWNLPDSILSRQHVQITWSYQTLTEFFELAQLKRLFDRYSIKSTLYIKYLPFARQDKDVENDTCFGLHCFAEMLNRLMFAEIKILDPHSVVACSIIDGSYPVYPVHEVNSVVKRLGATMVVYPDQGAEEKYRHIYPHVYSYAIKTRDQQTGEILSTQFFGVINGEDVLIVDDICDGGATFISLAQKLYEAGASTISLFVTHGIFSKGLKVLKKAGIKHIYTYEGEKCEAAGCIFTYRQGMSNGL